MDSVEQRLDELERKISRSGLGPETYFPGSLQVCRADKDGDGDFDPYTSTSWDGDSFSTSTGTIDWNADFGVPPGAKMVFILVVLRDSSATHDAGNIEFKAKSTTTNVSLKVGSEPSNAFGRGTGLIAVAPNGTTYYSIVASGASTLDVWIWVTAYAR